MSFVFRFLYMIDDNIYKGAFGCYLVLTFNNFMIFRGFIFLGFRENV